MPLCWSVHVHGVQEKLSRRSFSISKRCAKKRRAGQANCSRDFQEVLSTKSWSSSVTRSSCTFESQSRGGVNERVGSPRGQEFLAADQAEKNNCKDSQKVSGKMKCLHLAEKLTESQSVEMRSSKFFVGYCGSSLFPCHVVFSRGSMSRPWISCFQRHSSPYRGMKLAGRIQGVEPDSRA